MDTCNFSKTFDSKIFYVQKNLRFIFLQKKLATCLHEICSENCLSINFADQGEGPVPQVLKPVANRSCLL